MYEIVYDVDTNEDNDEDEEDEDEEDEDDPEQVFQYTLLTDCCIG